MSWNDVVKKLIEAAASAAPTLVQLRLADAELGDDTAPGYIGTVEQFVSLSEDITGWSVGMDNGLGDPALGPNEGFSWPFPMPSDFVDDGTMGILMQVEVVTGFSTNGVNAFAALAVADNGGDPSSGSTHVLGVKYQREAFNPGVGWMKRSSQATDLGSGTVKCVGVWVPGSTSFGSITTEGINSIGTTRGALPEKEESAASGTKKILVTFGEGNPAGGGSASGKFIFKVAAFKLPT